MWAFLANLTLPLTVATFALASMVILIGLYGNYRLYCSMNEQFMQPRSPLLQIVLNLSLLLSIVATCVQLQVRLSKHFSRTESIVYRCTSHIVLVLCYNLSICCLLTTSWLIYYREKWQFYVLKEKWQSIIRRGVLSTNWWIVNNARFGSEAFVRKMVVLYAVIIGAASVTAITCFHLDMLPQWMSVGITSIPLLVSTACYVTISVQISRMKVIADSWFVHWEREQIGKLLAVLVALYSLQQFVLPVFLDVDDVLLSLLFSPLFVVVTYGIHHISTFGIFAKNSSHFEKSQRRELETPLKTTTQQQVDRDAAACPVASRRPPIPTQRALSGVPASGSIEGVVKETASCPPQSTPSKASKRATRMISDVFSAKTKPPAEKEEDRGSLKLPLGDSTERITFHRLMGSDDGLHLFMLFLSTEFNMECLLGYIEMSQYQQYVLENTDTTIDEDRYKLAAFPDTLPISSIVESGTVSVVTDSLEIEMDDLESSNSHELKLKAHCLYKKYLAPKCEHECNISGRLRGRVRAMMRNRNQMLLDDKVTTDRIFLLFEDIKNELVRFLLPSFYAFKHSKDWQIVTDILSTDEPVK